MDRFVAVVVVAIVFALVQVFISNPIAQKLFPTLVSDSLGRRFGYALLHRLVLAALVIVVGGLFAVFAG